jgi:hypothetical protein
VLVGEELERVWDLAGLDRLSVDIGSVALGRQGCKMASSLHWCLRSLNHTSPLPNSSPSLLNQVVGQAQRKCCQNVTVLIQN